ncbi:MAG: DinB family protein [Anaerolineales bacterium]
MDLNRKLWNDGQQTLRRALTAGNSSKAIEQFLIQHGMVHSKKVFSKTAWSFEEELWQGLTEKSFRSIPTTGEHSIAWILYHIARIEDITMNILVADTTQLYVKDKWEKKLNATVSHSANKMAGKEIAELSKKLNMAGVREYRTAVGRRTLEIVKKLEPTKWNQKVEAQRLQKILDTGAVTSEALEIVTYWSKRTIAGLLLMPPTRHNFLHLNEAGRIKAKLKEKA